MPVLWILGMCVRYSVERGESEHTRQSRVSYKNRQNQLHDRQVIEM